MAHLFSSSPFHFGQRNAYYSVQVTIHELKDVPLVSGRFQAKWRVRNPHSTRATPAAQHQQQHQAGDVHSASLASRAVHSVRGLVEGKGDGDGDSNSSSSSGDDSDGSDNDTHEETAHEHTHGEDNDHLAIRRHLQDGDDGHDGDEVKHHDQDDASSIASSSAQSPQHHAHQGHTRAFLSNIFHRRNRKDSHASQSSPQAPASAHDAHDGQGTVRQRDYSHRPPDSPPRRQSSTTHSKSKQHGGHHHHRIASDTSHAHHAEPRGSTEWLRVQDHTVRWERVIHTGVRVPVEKPAPASSSQQQQQQQSRSSHGTNTPHHLDPSNSAGNSSFDSAHGDVRALRRSKSSQKDLRVEDPGHHHHHHTHHHHQHHDEHGEMSVPPHNIRLTWGSLGNSELKISIKQDIVTESGATDNPHSLGHVTVNLAEYAPCPATPHHHHHHHHHHRGHHAQYHNSEQQPSNESQSQQQAPTLLSRTETRRYLLEESKTNATLRLTITMTHIDGSRQYTVPVIKRGLPIGGMPSESGSQGGSTSRATDGTAGSRKYSQSQTSLHSTSRRKRDNPASRYFASKPGNGASRQTSRIPSSNFKNGGVGLKKLPAGGWSRSDQPVGSVNALNTRKPNRTVLQDQKKNASSDSVMTKRKSGAGGGGAKEFPGSSGAGLSYHFAGADSWEQDPDDVVQALFRNVADEVREEQRHGMARTKLRAGSTSTSGSKRPRSFISLPPDGAAQGTVRPGISPVGASSSSSSSSSSASIHSTRSMGAFEAMVAKEEERERASQHVAQASDQTIQRVDSNGSSGASVSTAGRGADADADAPLSSNNSTPCPSPRLGLAPAPTLDGARTPERPSTSGSSGARVKWSPGVADSKGKEQQQVQQLQPAFTQRSASGASVSTYGLTPSRVPSASHMSNATLSPSASTIMAEDRTPRANRNVSMPVFPQSDGHGLSHTIRKRKSKGLIGIEPSRAAELGYKGVGWQRDADPSRVANGSVPIRSSSPPPEAVRAGGEQESAKGQQQGGAVHIAPSVLVDSSFVSDEGGLSSSDEDDDDDDDDDDKVSRRRSLQPYISARLGRPRSRIGLNKASSRSVTGGPAPTVRQGERPVPAPAISGDAQQVPGLIPGSAAMRGTPTPSRTSSKPNLVWSDAQTELESRWVNKHGRPISGVALQPPPLHARSRADSGASMASAASGASAASSAHSSVKAAFVQNQVYDRPRGVPAPGIHVARELEARQ